MTEAERKKPARQRILDAASEMFYRDGVRAVGIDAIIARSGVAKMSLYRNFPSKDALVTAWLEDRNAFFWRRWNEAEASRAGNDPRGQLEGILDMIAATASHPKWRGCPFLNTGTEFPEPDHPARAVILAHKRAVRERLRALAATARARDPDLLAEQLQLLIDGAYSIGQSLGPDGPAKTVASAGRAVIAKAIAGPSTNGGALMPTIRLADGLSLHCAVDDYLWPWEAPTPVLMMHGFARNANFWNRWVPAIAESRRIYRPDLLGCGKSDVPATGYAYTAEKIGAQILAVLDRHSLSRVHWVGESSGGIIGLLLAAAHPERIASLVLCNTPTRIPDEIRGIYSLGQQSTAAAIRTHGTGEWCRQTLGYRLDLDHASPDLQEWVIAEMDRTRPDVAAALHECFEAIDVRPLLPGIKTPVLLLSGDKSRIASEQQKILADRLPHGRLELFAGYGHGVNLLQPERCARAALEFWRTAEEVRQ